MKTFLTHLLIWLPVPMGGSFCAVVKLDHWLYQSGKIGVRGAIGLEVFYLMLCLFGFLCALGVGIQLFKEGKRWAIICAGLSLILGLMLLGMGFQCGAAILYAT